MKFLRDRAEAKRPYTPLASLPSATNFYTRFARWRWGGTLTAYLFVSLAIGLAVAGCALAFGTAPASWAAGGTAPTPTATCPGPGCQTLPVALVVRGVVRPLAQSAVGSLTGGTVRLSRIVVGDRVGNGQALARVEPPGGGDAVLVTSPREGSVTAVSVHDGDTVMPGGTLMVVADMSRLQLETTDVDEFVVTRLYRDQAVTVAIPALEVTGLAGIVRSVGMQPVPSATGEHYPVVIDLADPPEHLMIGMAARVSVMEKR